MTKILIGAQTLTFPAPVVLVRANIDGKPNFMPAAWCGFINSEPPSVAVAVRARRYTHRGIRQNLTFSINVPSSDMVKEVDYCGIATGAKVDKAAVCHFNVFYGELQSAPLIEQCPVNLECQVLHTLDLGSHTLFIGRIAETHVSDSCLTDGKPDFSRMKPFVYTATPTRQYQALGDVIGGPLRIGRALRSRE